MRTRTARSVVHALVPLLLLVGGACGQWKVQRLSPAELVSQETPDRIQVTRRSAVSERTKVVLYNPAVVRDTLVGVTRGTDEAVSWGQKPRRDTLAIPVADVVAVAVRRFDPGATIALGLGIVGLIAIMAAGYNATPL